MQQKGKKKTLICDGQEHFESMIKTLLWQGMVFKAYPAELKLKYKVLRP